MVGIRSVMTTSFSPVGAPMGMSMTRSRALLLPLEPGVVLVDSQAVIAKKAARAAKMPRGRQIGCFFMVFMGVLKYCFTIAKLMRNFRFS